MKSGGGSRQVLNTRWMAWERILKQIKSPKDFPKSYRDHSAMLGLGIMEKKMETTIVYWGYMGIMENKMETTIILGLYHNMFSLDSFTPAVLCPFVLQIWEHVQVCDALLAKEAKASTDADPSFLHPGALSRILLLLQILHGQPRSL